MYDYFYGAEAEQFLFYRIPKVLLTEERFRSVSAEAKVLYGLLLCLLYTSPSPRD